MTGPLRGMVTAAEYGTRFDADVAVARLWEADIDATVVGDPAAAIAPHLVTRPGFRVLVRSEVVDAARASLLGSTGPDVEADSLDAWFYQRRFSDRPGWIRAATWMLIVAIPVPLALAAVGLLLVAVARAFP